MPRTKTTPLPATDPNTHRSARSTRKKPVTRGLSSECESEPSPNSMRTPAVKKSLRWRTVTGWPARAAQDQPEEDWLKAEVDVRARYAQ